MRSLLQNRLVLVSALGYFVDVFDVMIFSVVRHQSLVGLGVPPSAALSAGSELLNSQLIGLLIGGFFWGWFSDTFGRKPGLYGSIAVFSLFSVLNGLVTSTGQYYWCRLFAGVGLAGELGVSIALISEVLPTNQRGLAAAFVAVLGLMGAIAASLVGSWVDWRTAYWIGGLLGASLLVTRFAIPESALFLDAVKKRKELSLWSSGLASRTIRLVVACILMGLPIWYTVGILATFTPEIAQSLGFSASAAAAVAIASLGVALGSVLLGWVSERLRSRKKALAVAFVGAFASAGLGALFPPSSAGLWYGFCFITALFTGFGAILYTWLAESLATPLRATATSAAPNLVRGSAIVLVALLPELQKALPLSMSVFTIGGATALLSLTALWFISESYGRDLSQL
jgi:MFS transporter, putative metabolite:H+ symporter